MATSRQIVLNVREPKKNAVASSAGSADGNVTLIYDRDINQADIVATIDFLKQVVIDQEYKAAP